MFGFDDLPPWGETLLEIAVIAVVALVAYVVVRLAIEVSLRQLLERRSAEAGAGAVPPAELERRVRTVGRLAVRIATVMIVLLAALMVLGELGIDIGPAIAGLGIVGIAVGFGAQSLVRDWFSGVFIVVENQYSQGDVVRVAGVEGVVEDFSLRRTTLRDLDGSLHTVPNGQIAVASNLTRLWTTFRVELRLAESGDAPRAAVTLNSVGRELKLDPEWRGRLLGAPSVVRVVADSMIALEAQAKMTEVELVREELRRRAVVALRSDGIRVARERG